MVAVNFEAKGIGLASIGHQCTVLRLSVKPQQELVSNMCLLSMHAETCLKVVARRVGQKCGNPDRTGIGGGNIRG